VTSGPETTSAVTTSAVTTSAGAARAVTASAGAAAAGRRGVLVLVGFMGAGKTTVGRLLAAELGVPFTDSDLVIEERAGRPIRQIFADDGEPAFRQLEHEVIADLLNGTAMVLAVGGGAVEHGLTRKLLAEARVAYLRVSFAEVLVRVGGDGGRPMLARPDIADVYQERQAAYSSVATITVDVDRRLPEHIGTDILTRLRP
jgi:shikimate kinase